ncbi:MAG: hypothetical protein BGO55_08510 [Sphingobacteriales bacterium 50-39]|nr:hypothetical protein [Sphingobacteriales bacterium]OJW59305.1 MAG: hypothetical protein BGO55_08510 [Sphingobacteriales bacterium 50-39]
MPAIRAKNFVAKKNDNIKEIERQEKRKNRLTSIKNEIESGRMTNFKQLFAIMSETTISAEMEISFYTFRRKVVDPGEFTINEVMRFAALLGLKYDVMADWIRDRIKEKTKSRIFRA